MKKIILRVPEELSSAIQEWAKFTSGMEIVSIVEVSKEEVAFEHSGRDLDETRLTRAIENCMPWFWGNSAYAVVFCVCRDYLGMDISKAAFEKMVERLPYTKNRPYKCLPCTIANAFKNNPIFFEKVTEWHNFEPSLRIRKLLDELRKSLKL